VEDAAAEPGLGVTVKSEGVGAPGVAVFGWGTGGPSACDPCILVVGACMTGVEGL
jgi:hypothetical protein